MPARRSLGISGGIAAVGSLFFAFPSHAGTTSPDTHGTPVVTCIDRCTAAGDDVSYRSLGMIAGTSTPPDQSAILFHVKLRHHEDNFEFKVYGTADNVIAEVEERIKNSDNLWVDPTKVSKVSIILANRPPVTSSASESHCYFEDEDGWLANAGGACTVK